MNLSNYLRLPHPEDCDCSVCWSRREVAKPARSRSTPCAQCRPASVLPIRTTRMGKIAGVWTVLASEWAVIPASTCVKHTPPARPPKYWSVVFDTGKPTPYVPIYEPFELEA